MNLPTGIRILATKTISGNAVRAMREKLDHPAHKRVVRGLSQSGGFQHRISVGRNIGDQPGEHPGPDPLQAGGIAAGQRRATAQADLPHRCGERGRSCGRPPAPHRARSAEMFAGFERAPYRQPAHEIVIQRRTRTSAAKAQKAGPIVRCAKPSHFDQRHRDANHEYLGHGPGFQHFGQCETPASHPLPGPSRWPSVPSAYMMANNRISGSTTISAATAKRKRDHQSVRKRHDRINDRAFLGKPACLQRQKRKRDCGNHQNRSRQRQHDDLGHGAVPRVDQQADGSAHIGRAGPRRGRASGAGYHRSGRPPVAPMPHRRQLGCGG